MALKPLIAVFGATGVQGGGVAEYLLQDGGFSVRALTSNPNSERAKGLASQGAEVVKVDVNDVESVISAFEGVYGVFGITNFWEPTVRLGELQHGKNMVDAAKAVGVKHFVWSALDRVNDPIIPHWNTKAEVDDYLRASGVPRTSVYTMFYYENFENMFPLTKGEDGKLSAHWPMFWTDGPIGCYAVRETGAYVKEAFKNPERWIGQEIRIISEIITPRDVAKAFSEASGIEIPITEVSKEQFEASKDAVPRSEVWTNMKHFYDTNGNPKRDFAQSKAILPQPLLLHGWMKKNWKTLIPA